MIQMSRVWILIKVIVTFSLVLVSLMIFIFIFNAVERNLLVHAPAVGAEYYKAGVRDMYSEVLSLGLYHLLG